MRRSFLIVAAGVIILVRMPLSASAQSVAPCPNPADCIRVGITPSSQEARPGGVATIGITFSQGPTSVGQGGPDKIAALALTLQEVGGGTTSPLRLAYCALDADGLPAAVKPGALLSGYRVVVDNATCTSVRTHCLCPNSGSGITPDDFLNIVVYGPNPLPTPGTGINIPTLPNGELLTIDLQVSPNADGPVALHLLNQTQDTPPVPQPKALLSVGDKIAVDQTCSPLAVPGTAPCAAAASTSQVAFTDASVTISTLVCIGDKDGSNDITANEVVLTINAFAQDDVSLNTAADGNGSGSIEAPEAVQVILNFAMDTCNPYHS